ncbi:MAG: glycosyltransferase family A protein [Methyloprofundus sp.]|nr:glycosyltransferase family A protein [Methyloprofundus sp.]
MSSDLLSIQVLICTHNRVELLKRTLHFINKAKKPNHCSISLFIVANACTDKTIPFLKAYQNTAMENNHLPLTWFEEPKPGKSNALNTAIPKLEASFTAMIDDDHRVDENYFIALTNACSHYPEADFFCGKIIPDWNGSEPHWVHDQGKYRIYPLPVPRFDLGEQAIPVTRKIAVPGGGNLVIKTKLFKTIGGFSTALGPTGHNLGGGEDYDWVIRAYDAGAKLQYIPDMIQFHYVDNDRLVLGYLIKKSFERTSSVMQLSQAAQTYSGRLFPRYLLKKISIYLFHFIFSLTISAKRFYLVRLAAALGEINAFLKVRKTKH